MCIPLLEEAVTQKCYAAPVDHAFLLQPGIQPLPIRCRMLRCRPERSGSIWGECFLLGPKQVHVWAHARSPRMVRSAKFGWQERRKRRRVDAGRHGRSNAPGINRRPPTNVDALGDTVRTAGSWQLACCCRRSVRRVPTPRSRRSRPQADDIQWLYKLIFWLALVVFVGVQFAIVYTVLRYRRRANDERARADPRQQNARNRLDDHSGHRPAGDLHPHRSHDVRACRSGGRRQFHASRSTASSGGGKSTTPMTPARRPASITANEIVVPVKARRSSFKLFSNNVIHSFWVPQLVRQDGCHARACEQAADRRRRTSAATSANAPSSAAIPTP